MNHVTIGVAGHIDHGKTALVRALTGKETDRLAEEQARGMSIVLGFAHLTLPEGEVDLLDVPGHEKFVRTMISGATGIDAALLVVAANEGVKPQTIEHVALMDLLGVKQGIVAITKSDLLPDAEYREMVAEDLRELVSQTFLRDAPLVFLSSVTGEGLDQLQAHLSHLLCQREPPPIQPYFTLPVDRAFTITGHGTVVTGTLRRGALQVGQTVEIFPGGMQAEVRGLEVHNQAVTEAAPGWRTAVNLRGVKKDEIERGHVLATPGILHPTRLLDVEIRLLASAPRPVKRGATLRLHYGTAEALAAVYPLTDDLIAPGETCLAQLRLTEEIAVPVQEPFILRALSPVETLGGGVVVDPSPFKHGRKDADAAQRVHILAHGTDAEKLLVKLLESGPAGQELSRLMLRFGLATETFPHDLLLVQCGGDLALHGDIFDELCAGTIHVIHQFHAAQATKRGMPREELRRRLPRDLKPVAFGYVLEWLTGRGEIDLLDGLVRQASYSPESAFTDIEREIANEIERLFRQGGLKPPSLEEALQKDRRRKNLFYFLVEKQRLIPTTDRTSNRAVVFHADAIEGAKALLASHLSTRKGMAVSELNALLGTTRKYSIPLLEYLDSLGVTKRVGDLRIWNGEEVTK